MCTLSESNESTHDKVETQNGVCNVECSFVHCFKILDPMCMTINYKREFEFQPYQWGGDYKVRNQILTNKMKIQVFNQQSYCMISHFFVVN